MISYDYIEYEMAAFAAPSFADNGPDDPFAYSSHSSSPPKLAKDDKWEHVQDTITRRRIQNRISQRNRRKRLKETGKDGQPRSDGRRRLPSSRPISSQDTVPTLIMPEASPHNDCDSFLVQTAFIMTDTPSSSSSSSSSTSHLSSDLRVAQSMSDSRPMFKEDTNSTMSHILSSRSQLQGRKTREVERYETPLPCNQNGFEGFDQDSWNLSFPSDIQGLEINNLGLLPNGVSPLLPSLSGYTALHLAVQRGHAGIVQLLLDTGVDINTTTPSGLTPLHLAASMGKRSTAHLLLQRGASTDLRSALGQTPLHFAVEKDHLALVQLLLDYCNEPDAPDCEGRTPFHLAVARGQEEIVRFLLMRGVNLEAKVGARLG